MKYLGFEWDTVNRSKLAAHDLSVETRWVRVVTAYEAEHERWWKIYRQKTKSPKAR